MKGKNSNKDNLADCLQLMTSINVSKIDLKTNNDQPDFLQLKKKSSLSRKQSSSLFLKKLNFYTSSNKYNTSNSQTNQSSLNSKKSDNPEDIASNVIHRIVSVLNIKSEQQKSKIIVPSLIKSKKLFNKPSMQSNIDEYYEQKASYALNPAHLNTSNSSNASNTSTSTTSRRKVKDINWPAQLQPSQPSQKSIKTVSQENY